MEIQQQYIKQGQVCTDMEKNIILYHELPVLPLSHANGVETVHVIAHTIDRTYMITSDTRTNTLPYCSITNTHTNTYTLTRSHPLGAVGQCLSDVSPGG